MDTPSRAINGHVGNTGYKLEYRFHYLWETIRLGSARNTSPDIVNLQDAESAFLASARYARRDELAEAGRAFLAAGWAAYCQGKMDAAKQHTEQAVALFPALAEAHFQLAKVQMHVGESEKALAPLRRAIELDRVYSIKAVCDGDFQRHETRVQGLLETLRREAKERANAELMAVQREAAKTEKESVQEYSVPRFSDLTYARRELEHATTVTRVETYFGYLNAIKFCGRAKEVLQHAKRRFVSRGCAEIEHRVRGIKQQVDGINAQIAEVNAGHGQFGENWVWLFLVGLLVSVIVGFVQCGRAQGFEASFNALFEYAMFFGIFSAIVAFIGYQVQKWETLVALNNKLAAINSEKERLELIRAELQRREKQYGKLSPLSASPYEQCPSSSGVTIGKTYLGKVVRIYDFGAFIELCPGAEGLLKIIDISQDRVQNVRDQLCEGDYIPVKVMGVTGNKIHLSRKAASREDGFINALGEAPVDPIRW